MGYLFDSPGNIYGNRYWGYKAITVEDIQKHDEWWGDSESMTEEKHDEFESWSNKFYPPVYLTEDLLYESGFKFHYTFEEGLTMTHVYKISSPKSEFQKSFRIMEAHWYDDQILYTDMAFLEEEHVLTVDQPKFLHSLQEFFRAVEGSDFFNVDELNENFKYPIKNVNDDYDELPF
jgi:hypothetical protein